VLLEILGGIAVGASIAAILDALWPAPESGGGEEKKP